MSHLLEPIKLAFICDDNYAICTGVAITSLKRNRNINRQYKIYVLADSVNQEKCQLFEELSDENFEIQLIHVERIVNYSAFGKMKFAMHVSTSALYKFNLPEILSSDDKVLYMDGDIIIRDSLEALYDIDISEYYAAVCKDIGAEDYPSNFKSRLNINHSGYFNSGVMLLNLKLLRENGIPARLIDYKKNGINHFMDQDAFNVIFEEKVIYFSFLYNMAISCWRDRSSERLAAYYDMPGYTVERLYREAKVIHCSAPEKPWLYFNAIAADEWLIYFVNSPFRKLELRRSQFQKSILLRNGCTFEQIAYCTANKPNVMPVVSVIIPVYNAEEYLPECIESLLCQTFGDAEFIFVDDGSTDRSWEILQHYARLDLRVQIYRQKNQRAGIARNNGISHAKGEFITFLDSDDIMLPNALELFYHRACETKADIVISSAYHFSNDVNKRSVAGWCLRKEYLPKEEVFSVATHAKYLFQVTAGAPWGKFYKANFIHQNQLCFPNVPRSEDVYFMYWALAVAKSITTLNEKTILYRIVEGNGSLEDSKDQYPIAQTQAREQLWQKLNEIGIYPKVEQTFLNGTINGLSYHFNGFKTKEASRILYEEFKNRMIPLYNLDMSDPSYFYSKGEYNFVKKIYDSKSFEDYWDERFKCLKRDADYYYQEMQKMKAELVQAQVDGRGSQVSEKMIKELAYYKGELRAVKNSKSYKIGRFITFIPRKIRGGIRCYHEHGWYYTWQRLLVHLHLKRESI